MPRSGPVGPIRDPAPLAMVPLRGFGGDGAGAVATGKDPQMSYGKTPRKTEVARAKSRAKRPAKPGNIPAAGYRDQTGSRPRPAQTAQGCNDRRHHEGDGLAAALGPRLLRGCGAQEARLSVGIGEGGRRTRLSCDGRTTVQIEAEDRRSTGRLAMALMDSRAIEGEIDRIRSLGLEELRREWRRLYHAEPPRTVATWLSLPSVTDFRKSRMAGSANRRGASCKRWRRPCGQRAGLPPHRASA